MTKHSSRRQKRSENALTHKAKAVKSNKKKCQSSSNLQYEKSTVILEGVDVPCVLVSSPKKQNHVSEPNHMEISSTQTPLSNPVWGSCNVWVKTADHKKSRYFQLKHPRVKPNTRAILIDWLMEVSEAYTLHRQTFYLAQDYFDRFMLTQKNIEKSLVQLIGVTCLFIAAKMEEACPPKLSQMAYVTAETYYEDEILQMEMLILKALNWNLCPETAVSWLQLYFQMISMNPNSDLMEPQFPQDTYVQMTKLLDLCIIDINSMDFEYRVLAASVLSNFVQQSTVEKVSGLSKDVLQPCLNWMAPFMNAAQLFGKVPLKDFKNVKPEDSHNIQTHTDYLSMQIIACKDQ